MNLSIFKSYDIRGIYPTEFNEKDVPKIGRAFVEHTGRKKIVVGRDMRISSPVLAKEMIKAIADYGANVYDVGMVPIDFIYFAVGSRNNYDGGIMVTASHNPKEYNGFKMIEKVNGKIRAVRGKDLIKTIEGNDLKITKKRGKIESIDIWQDYLEHIFSFVDIKKIKPFKVVVDAGNGMSGKVIPLIAERLPIKLIPLNFKLDGNFPAHPSNPLAEGAANQISQVIKKNKADFGFIFDGDADRIFLVDELGNLARGDITLLILAKYFLKNNPPESGVVYNLICSRAVPEFIKKWGGRPIRTKVGFVNISKKMMENNGVMGGELSGHFSFRDSFYTDSGFIAFLVLLQAISESGKKTSELAKELSPYFKLPEINFKTKEKEIILEKIKEKYRDGKQDFLDGITVEYNNWWFNLRSSQTEPLLRLTIEAKSEKILEEKKKELISFLR